ALILAAISIVLTLVFYAVDYTLLATIKIGLLSLVIFLGYGIYAGITYRKEIGGYISFKNAFMHGFIVFAVSALISTVFNILLYTVIDPELGQKLTDVSVQNAEEMMRNFGMPEGQMDEALEKARTDAAGRYTIGGLALGYVWALIGCAIFALISGAIVKKKQPESI
ncbi:MAG TPA: DUF4199 domain-containing protein, partial [Cyclobacteriaceae bacterium]|nr:DUF4199 domain-containing protein [Cyclobacteriaceae bacterium]